MSPPALAVDAGQTQVRAALVGERGPAATEYPGDVVPGVELASAVATAPGVERIDGVAARAEDVGDALIEAISRLVPPPTRAAVVAVGLSGFEAADVADLERVAARLRSELLAEQVVIASDGVTSLLGALGARSGAVVAAGTGTIVVARGERGWARVDGWGSLLGDAGSGFAIGRAGLDAALRALDGRGGSPELLEAALGHFAIDERLSGPVTDICEAGRIERSSTAETSGAALVEAVHRSDVPTRAVAGFAEAVGRLAGDGEAVSVGILADAGRELARSAAAALDRALDDDEPTTVSYAGNVFRAGQPLLEPFATALLERRPGMTLIAPAGDALAGATLLALEPNAVPARADLLWRSA